jgi:hypothetical protein
MPFRSRSGLAVDLSLREDPFIDDDKIDYGV